MPEDPILPTPLKSGARASKTKSINSSTHNKENLPSNLPSQPTPPDPSPTTEIERLKKEHNLEAIQESPFFRNTVDGNYYLVPPLNSLKNLPKKELKCLQLPKELYNRLFPYQK